MSKRAQTPLGRYADLRDGGNLPKRPRNRFPALMLFAVGFLVAAALLVTMDKALGHHLALTCGAC